MCLLLIANERKLNREEFERCFRKHSDGMGFSWFKDGLAHFKKGFMDVNSAWEYHETLTLPFVAHFRTASSGGVKPELTHPFIVSDESPLDLEGSAEKLLFMNGSSAWWPEFLAAAGFYPEKDEIFSDARAISIIINNGNEEFLRKLGTSRFVVVDSTVNKFWYYGDFTEENGILFSNDSWKPPVSHQKKTAATMNVPKSNVSFNHTAGMDSTGIRDYDRPWNDTVNVQRINAFLRGLLNKLTLNASQKMWKKCVRANWQGKDIFWLGEQAIKVGKQQKVKAIHIFEKHINSSIVPTVFPDITEINKNYPLLLGFPTPNPAAIDREISKELKDSKTQTDERDLSDFGVGDFSGSRQSPQQESSFIEDEKKIDAHIEQQMMGGS